jgi:hypothetical protein
VVEQRRSKRFDIKLPVRLVRNGFATGFGACETRNLSSGGVLLASDTRIDVGEPLEYVINLTNTGAVNLRCLGKVTRLDETAEEPQDLAKPFEMAVTLERYEFIRENG